MEEGEYGDGDVVEAVDFNPYYEMSSWKPEIHVYCSIQYNLNWINICLYDSLYKFCEKERNQIIAFSWKQDINSWSGCVCSCFPPLVNQPPPPPAFLRVADHHFQSTVFRGYQSSTKVV